MIEVWLYGDLRRRAGDQAPARLSLAESETVGDLLRRLDIAPEEVSHIFLNGKLLLSRSSMAPWLGYRREEGWTGSDFNPLAVKLRPGDRLGIFPRKMGMLVV